MNKEKQLKELKNKIKKVRNKIKYREATITTKRRCKALKTTYNMKMNNYVKENLIQKDIEELDELLKEYNSLKNEMII